MPTEQDIAEHVVARLLGKLVNLAWALLCVGVGAAFGTGMFFARVDTRFDAVNVSINGLTSEVKTVADRDEELSKEQQEIRLLIARGILFEADERLDRYDALHLEAWMARVERELGMK